MVKEESESRRPTQSEDENLALVDAISSKYWNNSPAEEFFVDLFRFNGIAYRGCVKYIGDLTSDKYEITDAVFEKIREDLKLDMKINYAAERAYVSGISFLYLGVPDGKDINEPLDKLIVPEFVQVVPKSWMELDEDNKVKLNEDGTYSVYQKDGVSKKVHSSRFIKIQLREDEKSSYLPAMRALITADNNLWSSGQALFRGAAGLTHVAITDPKKAIGSKKQNEIDYIRETGVFDNINAETTFISDARYDLNVKAAQGSRVSIKEVWENTIIECSIALKIPWQMLIGANAGAIAGSETNMKDYFGEINQDRIKFMDNIYDEFAERIGLDKPDIQYDTLFEETDKEKTEMFKNVTDGVQKLSGIVTNESIVEHLNDKFETNFIANNNTESNNNLQNPQTNQDNLLLEYMVSVYREEYGIEAAKDIVRSAGFRIDDVEITDYAYEFYQFRGIEDGSMTISELNKDDRFTLYVAEKKIQEEIQEIPKVLFDANKPFIPETVPRRGSIWEKPKFMSIERKANRALQNKFDNSFSFDNLARKLKGAIFFVDSYGKDAEEEGKISIDQEVDNFSNEAKLAFSPILVAGIDAAIEEAKSLVKKKFEISDRNKQLQKTIQTQAMDKVVGASDDMRKDLKRELETAMVNNKSPKEAAKAFKAYVSTDFANRYKNRLNTIAEQEMNNVFNSTAQATYEDSGIVKQNQWLTAGDSRVRPEHAAIHGQVVNVGDKFSLGVVRPPHGVKCRCSIIPYFK